MEGPGSKTKVIARPVTCPKCQEINETQWPSKGHYLVTVKAGSGARAMMQITGSRLVRPTVSFSPKSAVSVAVLFLFPIPTASPMQTAVVSRPVL